MSALPVVASQRLSPGDAAKSWVPHPVLDDLQHRLQAELTALDAAMRTSVLQAAKVGAVLIEAKATIGHGRWLDWVERTVGLHARTSQNYMLLAERLRALSPSNAKRISHLGIGDALRELRKDSARSAPASAPAPTPRPAVPIAIEGSAERLALTVERPHHKLLMAHILHAVRTYIRDFDRDLSFTDACEALDLACGVVQATGGAVLRPGGPASAPVERLAHIGDGVMLMLSPSTSRGFSHLGAIDFRAGKTVYFTRAVDDGSPYFADILKHVLADYQPIPDLDRLNFHTRPCEPSSSNPLGGEEDSPERLSVVSWAIDTAYAGDPDVAAAMRQAMLP